MVLVAPRLLYPPLTDRELDRQRVTVGKDRIELKREQDKLQNDARGALLQGLGGAVLLLGAYFTWRQLQVSREGQITDRFTRAVDQLGSEHLDVRLGGIYGLERIARDSPPDRVTIEEVLTAYVRGHAPWPPPLAVPTPEPTTQPTGMAAHEPLPVGRPAAGRDPAAQPPATGAKRPRPAADIQAAVTVLGRRQLPPDRLRELDLTRVDLRDAFLGRANLQGAALIGANLQGAWLLSANLQGAELSEASLQGAELVRANLQDASLYGANLEGAQLMDANLQRAWLQGANLQGAELSGANTDLRGARADGDTRWPAGWTREQAESRGVEWIATN
jgi:hypothetical protein